MKLSAYLNVGLFLIIPLIYSSCSLSVKNSNQLIPSEKERIIKGLPVRSFEIDGGFIDYQVLVVRDVRRHHVFLTTLKIFPTNYLVNIKNDSKKPVYSLIEWKFTEKQTLKLSSARIPPGYSYRLIQEATDVIEETKMSLIISIFSDLDHSKKIGEENTVIFLGKEDVKAYRSGFSSRDLSIIDGFSEMNNTLIKEDVPGSNADNVLQKDIQLLLWKEESKKRRDCEHESLKAEIIKIEPNRLPTHFSDKLKGITLRLAKKGLAVMENWRIRSCNTESTYGVLIVKDPESGTNIATWLIE